MVIFLLYCMCVAAEVPNFWCVASEKRLSTTDLDILSHVPFHSWKIYFVKERKTQNSWNPFHDDLNYDSVAKSTSRWVEKTEENWQKGFAVCFWKSYHVSHLSIMLFFHWSSHHGTTGIVMICPSWALDASLKPKKKRFPQNIHHSFSYDSFKTLLSGTKVFQE